MYTFLDFKNQHVSRSGKPIDTQSPSVNIHTICKAPLLASSCMCVCVCKHVCACLCVCVCAHAHICVEGGREEINLLICKSVFLLMNDKQGLSLSDY